MNARRKSKPPADAFIVADKGYRPRFVDSGGTVYTKPTDAFYKVIELVFPAVDRRELSTAAERQVKDKLPDLNMFYPIGTFHRMHVAPPGQRKAMTALFLAVSDAIEAAHQSGIERGKSLLIQLAKGAITTKELNDHAAKQGEE